MKTETLKGTIETSYGKTLPTPVEYEGTLDIYQTPEEVRAANDWPSNDEIVSLVNQKRTAAARAKFMKSALDAAGIEKPTLKDPEEQFKTLVKVFEATGKSNAEAKAIANASLGTSY